MFSSLLVAFTPFIINGFTGLIKKLPAFSTLRVSRRPVIRLLAGAISLVYVTLGVWLEPDSVSQSTLTTVVETTVLAFVAWMSSLGSYQAFFKEE